MKNRIFAQLLQHAKAIPFWHVNIKNYQMGAGFRSRQKGFLPIRGFNHDIVSMFEDGAEQFTIALFIVSNQDDLPRPGNFTILHDSHTLYFQLQSVA
ncbi:hypothetical protein RBB80_23435 [Tunturiibacter gelidiferens]